MTCHLSPPTRLSVLPRPMLSRKRLPKLSITKVGAGLRHNMTAPFAPHAVPAALYPAPAPALAPAPHLPFHTPIHN